MVKAPVVADPAMHEEVPANLEMAKGAFGMDIGDWATPLAQKGHAVDALGLRLQLRPRRLRRLLLRRLLL